MTYEIASSLLLFFNNIRVVIRFSLCPSVFWYTNNTNNTPIGSTSRFGAETGGNIFGVADGKGQFRNFGTRVWLIIKEDGRDIIK